MNAFLQALRNVTFYLQSQLAHTDGFAEWYEKQRAEMRADELLRKFVEGRNIVVKQRNLVVRSVAQIGMFRYRKPRMGMYVPVPVSLSSEYILREMVPKLDLLDETHSAIGEEYGVQRTWTVEELGPGNVLQLCDQAWSKVGHVLASAHPLVDHTAAWCAPAFRVR